MSWLDDSPIDFRREQRRFLARQVIGLVHHVDAFPQLRQDRLPVGGLQFDQLVKKSLVGFGFRERPGDAGRYDVGSLC